MQENMMMEMAHAQGFAEAYFLDASLAGDAPPEFSTLLLLLMPYHSWAIKTDGYVQISPYYFTAQKAHLAAKEVVRQLCNTGEEAELNSHIRLKPLLRQLTPFIQGRNTLDYHKAFGSRFHLQLICLKEHHPMTGGILRQVEMPSMCGQCKKCMSSCPTGAILQEEFSREKCLRHHMMSGKPAPSFFRSLMGTRLIGCDICQEACPYNGSLANQAENTPKFLISSLLPPNQETAAIVAKSIGKNEANLNRLCAQACIAAGNSKDLKYLPQLKALLDHASETVAEHASWAVKKLTDETAKPTS